MGMCRDKAIEYLASNEYPKCGCTITTDATRSSRQIPMMTAGSELSMAWSVERFAMGVVRLLSARGRMLSSLQVTEVMLLGWNLSAFLSEGFYTALVTLTPEGQLCIKPFQGGRVGTRMLQKISKSHYLGEG